MSKIVLWLFAGLALAIAGCSPKAATLQSAAETMKVAEVNSIEFSGTGRWHQFGQAANPTLPWPQFDVSSYKASIDYAAPAARVEMTRKQTIEPGRARPAPVEQKPDQYLSGTAAWNMAPPPGSPPETLPMPQPQPAAVAERTAEVWSTPHGFLKAALANNAASKAAEGGTEIEFTAGNGRYVGTINADGQVTKVQTWIDNPVLGDTLIETAFSAYRDFGGIMFPAKIVRTQGGHPVLDIDVADVKANAPVAIAVPAEVASFTPPPVKVDVATLAPGVFFLTGGSHHSVAIDQKDHIVVVEGPQNEERSLAVIAKTKELIPGKPIRYMVNTHAHFDHSGGLRTYVDEGATIVTHEMNKPYYETAWAAPHTINPDKLATSKKAPAFETYKDKHVLTDGVREVQVHPMVGNGHNDAYAMIYLPAEKILIQVDSYAARAPGTPAPATPNPFAVALNDNITRLGLDVRQLVALHGPRVTNMAELRGDIGL